MLIVVKIGTSTLTSGTNKITPPLAVELVLARQIAQIQDAGHQVILVSSGADCRGRWKCPAYRQKLS